MASAFSGWVGSGTGSYTGPNNPVSITMNGPITEMGNFSYTTATKSTRRSGQLQIRLAKASRAFSMHLQPYETTHRKRRRGYSIRLDQTGLAASHLSHCGSDSSFAGTSTLRIIHESHGVSVTWLRRPRHSVPTAKASQRLGRSSPGSNPVKQQWASPHLGDARSNSQRAMLRGMRRYDRALNYSKSRSRDLSQSGGQDAHSKGIRKARRAEDCPPYQCGGGRSFGR